MAVSNRVAQGKTEMTGTIAGAQDSGKNQKCVCAWQVSAFINRLSDFLVWEPSE